jgi:hypothetical protein
MICARCQHFSFRESTKMATLGFGSCGKQPELTPGLPTYTGIYRSAMKDAECGKSELATDMASREKWIEGNRK